jgi:hypothetical protein
VVLAVVLATTHAFTMTRSRSVALKLSMAGFGAAKAGGDDAIKLGAPEDISVPCACGSKLSYSACCLPAHDGASKGLSPEKVLRARFSAFSYGIVPYIMESTHPSMRDYVAKDEANNRPGRSKRDVC